MVKGTRVTDRRVAFRLGLALVALILCDAGARAHAQAVAQTQTQTPAPEAFFGFKMGADGQLADWPSIQKYFRTIADASDRVEMIDAGPTTDGNRLIGAVISAPENIRNLAAIQATNRRLADPRGVTADEARTLAASHKAVLAIGASIHASEIGASQAANELLYTLATATDDRTMAVLRDVVLILIPSLNPDGHTLVVDWYRRTKDAPYDGGPMPWLYHKYVGHDINRDAFMLNMTENRSLARFFYREWHPQVFLTMHQMGQRGPRFFVPPNYDPVDPNYDPLIWRTAGLLGHAMALELERDNRSGVVSNAMYDYYWPGYEDSAPLGHNTVCLLTEVASVRVASPITVAQSELTASTRGLPEYRIQQNFPNPWPGGAWRLRDIVDYDLTAVRGLLDATARYRREIVENFYLMGARAVERGRKGGPFAFIVTPDQHDPLAAAKLVNLLIDAGVEVHRAQEPFRANGEPFPAGSDIILMAQPFRAYAKTLLERQEYPARRTSPNGPPERPYDVAGWTLPYQMGVNVVTAGNPFEPPFLSRLDRATTAPAPVWGERGKAGYYIVDARGNAGALAANRLTAAGVSVSWTLQPSDVDGYRYASGALIAPVGRDDGKAVRAAVEKVAAELGLRVAGVKGKPPASAAPIARARVGLYKPWVENIDEGWTRFLLEQYGFPFRNVADAEMRAGNLRAQFDVIILPDAPADRLTNGHRAGTVPDEYAGGLGAAGVAAIKAFVEEGGALICLDSAGALAIEALRLPVRDVAAQATAEQFFCPGSIVRLKLDPTQPLSFGMREDTAGFFAYSAAYDIAAATQTADGHGGASANDAQAMTSRTTAVARYAERDVLMSGWLEGEQVIAGRAAVVDARVGAGRVVLLGFRTQHRAQSLATFRFLFNAILTGGAPPATAR